MRKKRKLNLLVFAPFLLFLSCLEPKTCLVASIRLHLYFALCAASGILHCRYPAAAAAAGGEENRISKHGGGSRIY